MRSFFVSYARDRRSSPGCALYLKCEQPPRCSHPLRRDASSPLAAFFLLRAHRDAARPFIEDPRRLPDCPRGRKVDLRTSARQSWLWLQGLVDNRAAAPIDLRKGGSIFVGGQIRAARGPQAFNMSGQVGACARDSISWFAAAGVRECLKFAATLGSAWDERKDLRP